MNDLPHFGLQQTTSICGLLYFTSISILINIFIPLKSHSPLKLVETKMSNISEYVGHDSTVILGEAVAK
jgi:hypothetical protein